MEVALHHIVLIRVKVFQISCQENTPPLSSRLWLGDESLSVMLLFGAILIAELPLEVTELRWQQPSLREELVVFRESTLHST